MENNMIPELRFPEFREEWQKEKVGNLCDFIVPGRNKPKAFDGNIPWITTPDIPSNGIVEKSKNDLAISKEEANKVGAKIVPSESIIMSCVGELGIVAKANNDLIINQQLHAFIPRDRLNNWFLFYELSTRKRYMEKVATKTAVPYMNKDNCNSIPIILPTLPEQTKIANFLTSVDKRINLLQKKKTELEQYKKGVMQKIFNQEIRFKDENGNDFPDWEEKRLGEIFSATKGQGLSKEEITCDGEHECILYGELYTTYPEVVVKIKSKTDVNKGTKSEKGDLLVPCSTTTTGIDLANVTALYENDVLLGGDITILRTKEKIDSTFYAYYLSNFKKYELAKYGQGTTIVHLYYSHFKVMNIDLPSYNEQHKIANFLISIDKSIRNISVLLDESIKFKKGLLQKMFC